MWLKSTSAWSCGPAVNARVWPAALLTGASLAAACLVVGEHVVATRDGCLDSDGWFTATPASWPGSPATPAGEDRISGCLDLDRIEIPAPTPAPDGRA